MTNLDSVFRREWGPAVAALARWSGDLTVAEDAVQEAFAEALRAWPRDGVPDNPGGMVLMVAGTRALDRLRRESVRPGKELAAVVDDIRTRTDGTDVHPVRDDELRMMFTCATPALDPSSQLALTLRLISGLTVPEIARALMQSEAAVGQRITRAKNKIRHANIPLRVPPAETTRPNGHPTRWPPSTRSSPRATGPPQDRRRSATNSATKESGSPANCVR